MNETIQSLKGAEPSHDNGDQHGWPQLSSSEPFTYDLFLSQFLNSLLVRAKLLKQCVDPGSAEEKITSEARHAIANFGSWVRQASRIFEEQGLD
jgi:hypothetical protein